MTYYFTKKKFKLQTHKEHLYIYSLKFIELELDAKWIAGENDRNDLKFSFNRNDNLREFYVQYS